MSRLAEWAAEALQKEIFNGLKKCRSKAQELQIQLQLLRNQMAKQSPSDIDRALHDMARIIKELNARIK